jgi:hypothetical protein
VRARVEHVIGGIKRVFGFAKVRYRGLAKDGNRLFVAAALANLFTIRATTGWPAGIGAPARRHQAPAGQSTLEPSPKSRSIDCTRFRITA